VLVPAEHAAASVEGITHAHARARWAGRTLRIDIEGWVDPTLSVHTADRLGCLVGDAIHHSIPEARAITFNSRAMPQPT
jgi:divalent metal cation (Fe/Co/Zn/Cd) transporter